MAVYDGPRIELAPDIEIGTIREFMIGLLNGRRDRACMLKGRVDGEL
jgi:hypothetical protein